MSEEGKKSKANFVCEFELSVCPKCGKEERFIKNVTDLKCNSCNVKTEVSHNLHDPKSGEWKKSKVCVSG